LQRNLSRRRFLGSALSSGTGLSVAILLSGCGGDSSESAATPSAAPAKRPVTARKSAGEIWKRLRLGAGGYVTGISIARDGTKVVHTDTHNAYIWNDQTKIWDELLTRKTLPQGDVPFPSYSPQSDGGKSDGPGCWEAAVANSNSSVIYAVWNAWCYRSTDRGKSFQKTALQRIYARANDQNFGGGERVMGPKMAIDPANANVVWLSGDMGDGLWATSDGGGSWAQYTQLPKPTDGTASKTNLGPYLVVFDPSSPVVGGQTQVIYVAVYGHGLFRSQDGGASFAQIPGAPTAFRRLTCDQLGRVWICDTSTMAQPIKKYENGTWTSHGSSNARLVDVAVNPANPAHIIAWSNALIIVQSKDGGATWQQWVSHADPNISRITTTAVDIPWLANSVNSAGLSIAAAAFDPSSGKCYIASGLGVFFVENYPVTSATRFELISQSWGIEQLCVWRIMAPPGGAPLTVQLDRSAMKLANPDVAPKSYGPNIGLKDGFDLDYSFSDPSYVVMLCAKLGNFSAYSRDRGDTWTYFPGKNQMSASPGGSIAVSEPGNVVHIPSNNGVARYTLDGGTTWLPLLIPRLPVADGTETGWGWLWALNRKILCADKVQAKVFYAYNYGPSGKPELAGLWKTTDGGVTWGRVKAGTIGQWTTFHTQMNSVPDNAGHLFFTAGREQNQPFYRSTDGGATWSEVANVRDVITFGFGKAGQGAQYPAVFIAGKVGGVYGIWRSTDNCSNWTQIGEYPLDGIDAPVTMAGDPNLFGRVYVGFGGSGAGYVDTGGV
jgi:photosystem II stability/assembly factor-like uncharacterized protein